jgi:hypothetical protein
VARELTANERFAGLTEAPTGPDSRSGARREPTANEVFESLDKPAPAPAPVEDEAPVEPVEEPAPASAKEAKPAKATSTKG